MNLPLHFICALPELILIGASPIILVVDLFVSKHKRNVTGFLSMALIAICIVLTLCGQSIHQNAHLFYGALVFDGVSYVLKLVTYLVMLATLIYVMRYVNSHRLTATPLGGEFYILTLFTLLGQIIVISAADLLTIYLGLELMTFPLYILVALKRNKAKAVEASTKFFILGALGTGLLLYGLSLIYGATATLQLQGIASVLQTNYANPGVMLLGIVFVISGIAFKLGAVPFHQWVPDVYEGAPSAIVLLIGGAPKIAAFAICFRLLVQGLSPVAINWYLMLMGLAVLSMALGNIVAIMQKNIKRMLAYSTIAQMGYMLLGFIAYQQKEHALYAYGSALYYTIVYVLGFLCAFGVILICSQKAYEAENIDDYKGLHKRNPLLAAAMLVAMFSMAGVPPLVGFFGKFAVFQALIQAKLIYLVIIAIVFAVIGAFYYLRIVKVMYFDEVATSSKIVVPLDLKIVLLINGLLLVILGVLPSLLMDVCMQVIQSSWML